MGSPKTPEAPKKDIAGDIKTYTGGVSKALPKIKANEGKYRPQFQELNLSDIQNFMKGVGGQQGLIGAGADAQKASQDQINAARSSEFANMGANAGQVRGILGSMSPESAAAVARANQSAQTAQGLESGFTGRAAGIMGQYGAQVGDYGSTISGANADSGMAQVMAQEAFARRGTLSQEEQRAAQQTAREASAASGRIGGNSGIAAEVLNRESAMAGRRSEAAGMGQQAYNQQMASAQQQFANENALFGQRLAGGQQNMAERQLGYGQMMDIEQRRAMLREEAYNSNARAYDMANSFYSAPGLQMLGMNPGSLSMGNDYLGKGMLGIGQGTPKLYDTGVALGIGAADRTNAFNAAAAQAGKPSAAVTAGAGALSGAATGATVGSVVPGIGTAIGAVGGAIIGGVGGYYSAR